VTEETMSEPDSESGARKLLRKKWQLFAVVSVLSLIFDQVTKIWARAELPTFPADCVIPDGMIPGSVAAKCVGVPVAVMDSFWHWRLSMNPGSAFGLFSSQNGARWGLSIVGIAAVFGMLWMLRKARRDQHILHWALALVTGGAVGNLVDRIFRDPGFLRGGVVDFISVFAPDGRVWPIFNVADSAIVCGGILGALLAVRGIEFDGTRTTSRARDRRGEAG
jgi:lipoprotein signal peptidase